MLEILDKATWIKSKFITYRPCFQKEQTSVDPETNKFNNALQEVIQRPKMTAFCNCSKELSTLKKSVYLFLYNLRQNKKTQRTFFCFLVWNLITVKKRREFDREEFSKVESITKEVCAALNKNEDLSIRKLLNDINSVLYTALGVKLKEFWFCISSGVKSDKQQVPLLKTEDSSALSLDDLRTSERDIKLGCVRYLDLCNNETALLKELLQRSELIQIEQANLILRLKHMETVPRLHIEVLQNVFSLSGPFLKFFINKSREKNRLQKSLKEIKSKTAVMEEVYYKEKKDLADSCTKLQEMEKELSSAKQMIYRFTQNI
eukprot:snap_masked-scaffold_2-processed-gene-5.25-mRNA-1 protein AED:1.00 eAED:1.00 QI:0/0/0/0/1/1/2/0/317